MPNESVFASVPDGWRPIAALLAEDGSIMQPGFAQITPPRAPLRDVADALHCLCLLHGHRPGAIDIARDRATAPVAREWLAATADGFAQEREWLARLVSSVGPLPSTPNQTASENAIATQRHALEMLAMSDRRGCALGASGALAMDWRTMRDTLDRIGDRLGLTPPPCYLPTLAASQALIRIAPMTPDEARAFHFGAQQLLAQHRGLWGLVEARASARSQL